MIHQILNQCQNGVSQSVAQSLSDFLPTPTINVVIVARIYGIDAMFFNKRESFKGGAAVNCNRWICRVDDNENVTNISVG